MQTSTNTTSTVTETINSIDYRTGWEYTVTGVGVENGGEPLNPTVSTELVEITPSAISGQNLEGDATTATGRLKSSFDSLDLSNQTPFTLSSPGRSLSIFTELFWTRNDKSNNNSKSNRNRKRNQYNKHLLKLGKQLCLISVLGATVTPAHAESVSATANPIANSSGSVTNQAIQVLQGPYITNTYGNGIQCQGSTVNFTPYIQYSNSWKDPFERHYMEPQYNMSDYTGKMTNQLVTVKNYPWYDGMEKRTK